MAKVKKILYLITQSEMGGAQRYVFDLVKNLKNEYGISVAFSQPGNQDGLAQALTAIGIPFYTLNRLRREISPVNDLLAVWEIRKLIKKIRPDIIHLNSSKISILGSLAAAGLEAKVIYTAHGWVFNEPLSPWKKTFYKLAEKLTAGYKDKIICVSEFDRQTALKENVAPANKLITILNGIEPIDFLSKEAARIKLNLPSDGLVIGSIGNLYKTKGYEYLVEAAKLLVKIHPEHKLHFIIIGDGEERRNLETLINNFGLSDKFILAGSINEASSLLKAIDIYVCSSVKEGLSYTLIEASQAGLPIVATDVGGNKEVIKDSQSGLLAPPMDAEQLAKKIILLINNTALAVTLAEGAKKNARDFQLGQMIKKVNELYLKI